MDISQSGGATTGILPAQLPQLNQKLQGNYGGVQQPPLPTPAGPASGMPKVGNNNKNNNNSKNNNNNKNNNKNNNNNNNKNNNNNNKNASNNNRNNALNSLKNLEVNMTKLPIWILLLLTNILLIWSYVVTPIRYSNHKFEKVITFNKLYYYLHIILLITLFLYGYSLSIRQPFVKNNTSFNTLGLVVVLIIGFFAINIAYKSPVKATDTSETSETSETSDTSDKNIPQPTSIIRYQTPPSSLYKTRKQMSALHTILLLSLLGTMGTDIYFKNINPLGLLPYTKLTNLYGVCSLITLAGIVYLLVNSITYNVRKYKLPKYWII